MDPHELEQLIDRELRALPAPRAPRTLMPRVMEAARPDVASAFRRTGVDPAEAGRHSRWPRLIAAAALLAIIAAVPWIAGSALLFERIAIVVDVTSGIAALMRVVWRALLEPVVTYAAVVFLLMAFLCAALWKALRAVALEGASHS